MNPPEKEPATLRGHLLVECLVAQGVQRAWGVPGESDLAALDGFHAHQDTLDSLQPDPLPGTVDMPAIVAAL